MFAFSFIFIATSSSHIILNLNPTIKKTTSLLISVDVGVVLPKLYMISMQLRLTLVRTYVFVLFITQFYNSSSFVIGTTPEHVDFKIHCSLPVRGINMAKEVINCRSSDWNMDGSSENLVSFGEYFYWV